jgi:hypothetical protein
MKDSRVLWGMILLNWLEHTMDTVVIWPMLCPSLADLNPLNNGSLGDFEANANATFHQNVDSLKAYDKLEWAAMSAG